MAHLSAEKIARMDAFTRRVVLGRMSADLRQWVLSAEPSSQAAGSSADGQAGCASTATEVAALCDFLFSESDHEPPGDGVRCVPARGLPDAAAPDAGAAAKKRRRIAEASSQEIYPDVHLTLHILSPLVSAASTPAKRKTCLENIAPFWALLQRAPEGGPANMALEYIRVRENAPDAAGWPVGFERAQRLANEVRIPMATTTRRIEEGDVLTLPFEAGCVKVKTGVVVVAKTEGQTLKGTEVR